MVMSFITYKPMKTLISFFLGIYLFRSTVYMYIAFKNSYQLQPPGSPIQDKVPQKPLQFELPAKRCSGKGRQAQQEQRPEKDDGKVDQDITQHNAIGPPICKCPF
ncbi:hypothetical protein M9H77_11182 [Catharanthus roseus]|uniref:Uncharacterized protein n=1 Tax=Catharanthus roseus TaxID=4058 RepID=A0ACC0BDX0_CATRO|nr:hypothetical protein M9H77_11182 [Catharanthus roseus]